MFQIQTWPFFHGLLPVVVAFVVLGLFLRTGGRAAGGSADEVVAGFAVGGRLLVVGRAAFLGLGGGLFGGWASGVLGIFGLVGLDLRGGGGVGVVIGIVVPADFFFVACVGACTCQTNSTPNRAKG